MADRAGDGIPDALVTGESQDPAAVAVSRESLRLALIAPVSTIMTHWIPRTRERV